MRIYLSHPIRGTMPNPTSEYLAGNLKKAIALAQVLRRFGSLEVYCPAEYEEFVQLAAECQYLTVDQILTVDKLIINACDAVIFYNFEEQFSAGMESELVHAELTKKPYIVIDDTVLQSPLFVLVNQLINSLVPPLPEGTK